MSSKLHTVLARNDSLRRRGAKIALEMRATVPSGAIAEAGAKPYAMKFPSSPEMKNRLKGLIAEHNMHSKKHTNKHKCHARPPGQRFEIMARLAIVFVCWLAMQRAGFIDWNW